MCLEALGAISGSAVRGAGTHERTGRVAQLTADRVNVLRARANCGTVARTAGCVHVGVGSQGAGHLCHGRGE